VNQEHESQVKDFLESHNLELQRIKTECSQDLHKLKTEHAQELASIKEAHQLEVAELSRNTQDQASSISGQTRQQNLEIITADNKVIKNLESDIKSMEEEKKNLKGMQSLMKGLISDLAEHYSLSEKQVHFLNNTSLLDSFLEGRSSGLEDESLNPAQTPWKFFPGRFRADTNDISDVFSTLRDNPRSSANTPNQSILSMEEISDLIRNGTFLSELENSGEVLKDLQNQVNNVFFL
jgi:hypothetical protein